MPTSTHANIRTNWTGVMFGFLLASLAAFQQFKLPPMLPEMLAAYDYEPTLAGAFMSIYAAIGLIATLLIGRLMQRYGAILLLAAGFGLALSGNALALAIPGDGYVMLGARALEGLAFAVFAVAGPVYTTRNAAPKHLPLAIALSAMWIPVGQLAASVLVPLAEITIGWRLLWLATAGATLSLGFWAISIQTGGRASLDLKPPASAANATQIRITGLEWAALSLGAALFTLWSAQYFAYMTWLPKFLVDRHGLSPNLATLAYSVPVAILLVFAILTSWALRRGVPVALMLISSICLQAAVWFALPVTDTVTLGAVSLVLYGIGIGFTPVCLFALPSTILGSKRAGPNAFAVLMTGRNMGGLIGPMLLPQVLLGTGQWEMSGVVFGSITALAAGGAIVLGLILLKLGRSRPD